MNCDDLFTEKDLSDFILVRYCNEPITLLNFVALFSSRHGEVSIVKSILASTELDAGFKFYKFN